MECRRAWNRDFLDQTLTKTFRSGPLRKHRAKILMEREKALLPAHQIFVEATREIDSATKADNKVQVKLAEALKTRSQILIRRTVVARGYRAATTPEQKAEELKELERLAEEYGKNEAKHIHLRFETEENQIRINTAQTTLSGGTVQKEAREFIARCPAEGCRGYLSSAYKCGTCAKYTCSECMVVKGDARDSAHTCNDEAKASSALIRKETKPCPKCGVRIFKIDGCDQMFCTQESCHTAFSWNTGRIVTGVIHNPHYYEYLRNRNGGVMPREAGDIPCGGLPHQWQFTAKVRAVTAIPLTEKNLIYAMYRGIADVIDRLPDYPARRPATMNKDINIRYLMNQTTEDDWKKLLEQRETRFERKKEIGQILTMFTHVGSDYMRQLDAAQNMAVAWKWSEDGKSLWKQFEDLRIYTNKSLQELGTRMMCAYPQIDFNWMYIQPHKEPTDDKLEFFKNPYLVNTNAWVHFENNRIARPPNIEIRKTAPPPQEAGTLLPIVPVGAAAMNRPPAVPVAPVPVPAQERVITQDDFVDDDAVVVE